MQQEFQRLSNSFVSDQSKNLPNYEPFYSTNQNHHQQQLNSQPKQIDPLMYSSVISSSTVDSPLYSSTRNSTTYQYYNNNQRDSIGFNNNNIYESKTIPLKDSFNKTYDSPSMSYQTTNYQPNSPIFKQDSDPSSDYVMTTENLIEKSNIDPSKQSNDFKSETESLKLDEIISRLGLFQKSLDSAYPNLRNSIDVSLRDVSNSSNSTKASLKTTSNTATQTIESIASLNKDKVAKEKKSIILVVAISLALIAIASSLSYIFMSNK